MSTAHPGVPALLAGLVDDAAVFPPGNAPLATAVADHRRHRKAWYGDVVGPLLCPASGVAELGGLLEPGERLRVALVADTGPGGLLAARDVLSGDPRAELVQVEAPLPPDAVGDLGTAARRLLDELIVLVDTFVEVPRLPGWERALDVVAGNRPEGAKFRTGGTRPEAFPSETELAERVVACARRRVRFKLTAGLHHALRHRDPQTGFEHHGFLNVLCAVADAVAGADTDHVAAVLAQRDPDPLVEQALTMDPAQARAVRALFTSFGSCSVSEPVADLAALGLLAEEGR